MATIAMSKRSIYKKMYQSWKIDVPVTGEFIFNDLLDFSIETFDVFERCFRYNKKTSI